MEPNISIYKLERSRYYYVQWTDENGVRKQKSTRCTEKGEAMSVLSDLKSFIKEKQKPILLSRFVEQYKLANLGTLSPGSIELCKYAFASYLRVCGDIVLNRITPKHWDTFKAERLQENMSPVTVNKELRTIRAALSTAVRWKHIEINPFKGQTMCNVPEKDAAFITMEQFKLISSAIHDENVREIASIAFFTGLRRNEILALRWSNIDFHSGVLFVRNSATFKTKTGKQRAIPINGELSMIFSQRKQRRIDECDDVFPGIRQEFASKQFKKAAKIVFGNETEIHFHSLRHSFCSNLLRAGANVRVVQSLAGHSSMATTEKYLHNVTSDARNAVNLLSMN